MRSAAIDVAAGTVGPPVVPSHAGVAPITGEAITAAPGPPGTQPWTHVGISVRTSAGARAHDAARVAVAPGTVAPACIAEPGATLAAAASISSATALTATLTIAGVRAVGRIRDKIPPIGRTAAVTATIHDPRSVATTTGIGKTAGDDQHRPAHAVCHDKFPLRNPNLNNASRRSLKSLSTATRRTFGKIGKLCQVEFLRPKRIRRHGLATFFNALTDLLAEKNPNRFGLH